MQLEGVLAISVLALSTAAGTQLRTHTWHEIGVLIATAAPHAVAAGCLLLQPRAVAVDAIHVVHRQQPLEHGLIGLKGRVLLHLSERA